MPPNMLLNMDKPIQKSEASLPGAAPGEHAGSPGYETRDANPRGALGFLVVLGGGIALTSLVCWLLLGYFSRQQAQTEPASPFAESRQLPPGPQLQVYPRADLLKYLSKEKESLESYAWDNRAAGTVRVPIERAMGMLLQKGLSVAADAPTPAGPTHPIAAKDSKSGTKTEAAPDTPKGPNQ